MALPITLVWTFVFFISSPFFDAVAQEKKEYKIYYEKHHLDRKPYINTKNRYDDLCVPCQVTMIPENDQYRDTNDVVPLLPLPTGFEFTFKLPAFEYERLVNCRNNYVPQKGVLLEICKSPCVQGNVKQHLWEPDTNPACYQLGNFIVTDSELCTCKCRCDLREETHDFSPKNVGAFCEDIADRFVYYVLRDIHTKHPPNPSEEWNKNGGLIPVIQCTGSTPELTRIYEPNVILFALGMYSKNFTCPSPNTLLPMKERCVGWTTGDSEDVCNSKKCNSIEETPFRKLNPAHRSADFLLFQRIYTHYYLNTETCTNLQEGVKLEASGIDKEKLLTTYTYGDRESSCNPIRKEEYIGPRFGCSIVPTYKNESTNVTFTPCYVGLMGQRCLHCYGMPGLTGDKCQFYNECEIPMRINERVYHRTRPGLDAEVPPFIMNQLSEEGKKWLQNPCGTPREVKDIQMMNDEKVRYPSRIYEHHRVNTCMARQNGKYCLCEPGYLNGFYNIYTDRVMDPILSPAGSFTNADLKELRDRYEIDADARKWYHYFIEMAPFHSYHGCRIKNPCHEFKCGIMDPKTYQISGVAELKNLINMSTPGFSSYVRFTHGAIEVSDDLSCECVCSDRTYGKDCGKIRPCVEFKDNTGEEFCLNGGTCTNIDDDQKPDEKKKKCECIPGWFGERCNVRDRCTIPCDTKGNAPFCNPCKNAGECIRNKTQKEDFDYTCKCAKGFRGDDCECQIDKILSITTHPRLTPHTPKTGGIVVNDPFHVEVHIGGGWDKTAFLEMLQPSTPNRRSYECIPRKEGCYYQYEITVNEVGPTAIKAQLVQCNKKFQTTKIQNITAVYPKGIKCLPVIKLHNVVDLGEDPNATIPSHPRNTEWTITKDLNRTCADETVSLYDYKWTLAFEPPDGKGKLENMHINETGKTPKGVHITRHSLSFKPYTLPAKRYYVEVNISININRISASEIAKGWFIVEMLAPVIKIEGGELRTVDVYKEVILDASNSIDPNYDNDPSRLNFTWHCKNCPEGFSKFHRKSIWKIPPQTLKVGQKYDFHLDVVSTDDPFPKSAQDIILMGSGATLVIDCVEPCKSPYVPGVKVSHRCKCQGCTQPKFNFSWEPITDSVVVERVVESESEFVVTIPHVRAEDVTVRKVICHAEAEKLIAEHEIVISRPPKLGNCGVSPLEGIYLVTEFSLNCEEAIDDSSVSYSFYAEVSDSVGEHLKHRYLLSHDSAKPSADKIYLPYNKPSGSPTKIVVSAVDRDGLASTAEFNAIVKMPNPADLPKILDNLVLNHNSILDKLKENGAFGKALQIQLVLVHGLLAEDNIFGGISKEKLKDLRNKLADVLTKLNSTYESPELKHLEQTINTLYLWHKYDDSSDSVVSNSEVLFQAAGTLAQKLTEDTSQSISSETVEKLARAGTDASGRILWQSVSAGTRMQLMSRIRPKNERLLTDYDDEDEIERDYFQEIHDFYESKEEGEEEVVEFASQDLTALAGVSHRALLSLEHFLDAAGTRLSVNGRFKEETEHVTVSNSAHQHIDKNGLLIEMENEDDKGVKINVSGSLSRIMKANKIQHVEIQVIETRINPYFDDDSAILGTPVVSLQIKDGTYGQDRIPIMLTNISKPFELFLPLKESSQEAIDFSKVERLNVPILRSLEQFEDSDFVPIYIILGYNTRWKITVADHPLGIEFSVAVRKDYWPTKHDYCDPQHSKVLNASNKFSAYFDTESIKLDEEPDGERLLSYYIGIFPYEVAGQHEYINYTVFLTRTSCLYRDEDKKIWSERGCIVGKDSTPSRIHCICDHASVFAGTQFAIPNSLPSVSIFDFNYEEFQRNPVVLTTVCVLTTLYIIFMIICWLCDRREKKRHVGITIMADIEGDPTQSYYLIAVRTDSRFGSGTTADVCMQIYGSNGRSQVYTLKEKEMPVLNRGGFDTYLVASKKYLGEIEKIRIWHDNTGISPTWFCRRVVITDVQTTEEFYFYVYRWIHVSGSETTIVFEQNVATEEEHTKFSRRYKENVSDQLDNTHLWLSLFRFPASSRFTRCQRLTCAFGILSSFLIMNIMFYGIELKDPEDLFGLQTYIVACQISLLSAPIGIILIELFRRIRQRYIPTLIIWKKSEVRKHLQDLHATYFVPQQKPVKDHLPRHSVFGDQNQTLMDRVTSAADKADSDASSNFSIPSTNIQDLEEWLEYDVAPQMTSGSFDRKILTRRVDEGKASDVEDHIAIGRLGLIRAVRAMDPSSFVFRGDHTIQDIERLIDQEIRDHLDPNRRPLNQLNDFTLPPDMLPVQDIPNYHSANQQDEDVLFLSDDEDGAKGDEALKAEREPEFHPLTFETCEMAPQAKALCYLPWWFIVIAWIFAIAVIFTCLYFTLLYGLAYGYERSVDWLLGVIFSFFLSLLIIQPIQIFVVSFFITIFCRSKRWSIIQEERFQILIKDEDDIKFRRPLLFRLFHPSRKYPPLSGHEILRLKVEARARERLRNAVLKLFFYLLLLIPLSVVAHWGQSRENFLLVDNMRNLLQLKDDQVFDAVNNNDDFFNYVRDILIPTLHPDKKYNGLKIRRGRYDPAFLQDEQNILVGVARIRQLRVVESPCHLPAYKCYGKYSIAKQDTASYNMEWVPKPKSDNSVFKKGNDIWKFHKVDQPQKPKKGEVPFVPSLVHRGELSVYYGGGYVAELGRTARETKSVIRHLERTHWIDQRTRVVFIEFTITNPNVQLYTDVKLTVEMGPSQAFECSYSIHPVTRRLSRTNEEGEDHTYWLEICYVAIFIFTIVLLINLIRNVITFPDKSQLVFQTGLWVDFVTVAGLFTSLGLSVKEHLVFFDTLKLLEEMKINQYINLQKLVYWSEMETAAFSILLSICFFKIFRILIHIDERFRVMSLTLKMSGKMLAAYAVFLSVVLIAFASSGHFLFGNEMKEFRSFGHSIVSIISEIVNVEFFEELSASNRFLGPIYSFLFGFFVVFMSMNLLIAVLSQAHYEAKLVSREGREEDSLFGNIGTVLTGCCSKPKAKDARPMFQLQPHRLEGMQMETVYFLESNLRSSQVRKLNEMKNYMNSILKGTGFRMVSNICRRKKEELNKEANIYRMRQIAADFLRKKLGTEMTVKEFRTYSDTNKKFMDLRLIKLEHLLELANERLNELLD